MTSRKWFRKKWSQWKRSGSEHAPRQDMSWKEEGEQCLSPRLEENRAALRNIFDGCSDIVFRELKIHREIDALMVFIDGIVDSKDIHDNVLRPLFHRQVNDDRIVTLERLRNQEIALTQFSKVNRMSELLDSVLGGNVALLVDGLDECLILNAIGGKRRSVEEPASEATIRGPREGFTENLRTNTALIRFRVKSPTLKMESLKMGKYTRTNVVLAYMEGIADPRVVDEVRKRLQSIKIDGVIESGYLEELIEDEPFSPFPQLQYTERPDTVASQLLEGRFAIFVDGTPFVLTGPVTFWQMLHASEDYYERFYIGNFIRWLRYVFLFLALFTPALYIAITSYHQDLLPTTLTLTVAASRESIPFPAIVETLIMELSFEALREASVRLPRTIGQSVSILGALVIGQAAVQAGIVSAPMVIIVSLTGIASFTIPRFNFAISIRLLRFPLMILAAAFGLFGIVIGTVWILVHLVSLRSFGVPYMSGAAPYKQDEMKDIFIRAPWWMMVFRPTTYSPANSKRMQKGMKPSPDSKPEG